MRTAPRKWRPSLALTTVGMIGLVLVVALGGFAIVRTNIEQSADVEFATALCLAMAAAAIVGAVFARVILRPVHELGARAERIMRGDAEAIGPLAHHGTREFALLSDRFMEMAQSLSNQSAYLRTYARHVSHELKTPLAAINGAAELMLDDENLAPEVRKRFLGNIVADVARMSVLLDRLNEQARAETMIGEGAARPADVLRALQEEFPELRFELAGETPALAISQENLALVLRHLVTNAAEHGATTMRIALSTALRFGMIELEDDGAGVAPGNRGRIFDPFFTTRRADGGTGMGLNIVRSMLAAHHGAIELRDSARGARFGLRLPLA